MSTRKQWHNEWRDWSGENAELCAAYGFPSLVSGSSTAEEDAGVASMTLLRDEHFSRVKGTTCAMLAGRSRWALSLDLSSESALTARADEVYVDHAGSTLYSEKYVRDCAAVLTTTLFGNPRTCL